MGDVRDHLAGCPHCSAELASLQELLALAALDETPAMPLSEDEFLQGVRRRASQSAIRSPQSAVRTSHFAVRLVPFLAAAAVLVAVGVFMLAHRSRARTESDYASVLAEPESPDLLDLAGSESELIRDLDSGSVVAIQSELTDNADVDELVEELTPRQQDQLVMELTRLYGGPLHNS
jgi:anti-sigma factor RsiW